MSISVEVEEIVSGILSVKPWKAQFEKLVEDIIVFRLKIASETTKADLDQRKRKEEDHLYNITYKDEDHHFNTLGRLLSFINDFSLLKFTVGASVSYPNNFFIETLLKKSIRDFLRIRQSYTQKYLPSSISSGNRQISKKWQITINLIHVLAKYSLKDVLQKFVKKDMVIGPNESLPIIAYESTRFEIRVLPYCHTLLIGYPFTALLLEKIQPKGEIQQKIEDGQDFYKGKMHSSCTGIAHEIGHKVYEHGYIKISDSEAHGSPDFQRLKDYVSGELTDEELAEGLKGLESLEIPESLLKSEKSSLQTNPGNLLKSERDWIIQKIEELFSDAYGIFIHGPASIAGYRSVLENNYSPKLATWDERYIKSPRRINAQAMMLEELIEIDSSIESSMKFLPEKIRVNWDKWVEINWAEENGISPISGGEAYLEDRKKVVLRNAIRVIIRVIQKLVDSSSGNWNKIALSEENNIEVIDLTLLLDYVARVQELYELYVNVEDHQLQITPIDNSFDDPAPHQELLKQIRGEKEILDQKEFDDDLLELMIHGWSDEGQNSWTRP